MSGERTPATHGDPPWTNDDEISLREHMQRQLDVIRETALVRFGLEREHTHDSIASTKELLEQSIADQVLRMDNRFMDAVRDGTTRNEFVRSQLAQGITDLATRLDERFQVAMTAQRERVVEEDKRYEQRFQSQEQAVQVALSRVDKEFHEHLVSVREETRAALDAADKAIHKSEVATEKRFESVNEFRAQLAAQAQSFMPRKESDVRMDSLTEKIDRNADQLVALQLQVTSRLDLTQGEKAGARISQANLYAAIGALGAILTIIIVLANLLTNKTP